MITVHLKWILTACWGSHAWWCTFPPQAWTYIYNTLGVYKITCLNVWDVWLSHVVIPCHIITIIILCFSYVEICASGFLIISALYYNNLIHRYISKQRWCNYICLQNWKNYVVVSQLFFCFLFSFCKICRKVKRSIFSEPVDT